MTSPAPGTGQVLVVDDEEDFRTVVAEHLEDLGYQASAARNGSEALALARDGSFDAALVDLKMPGIGGIEVLQSLRQLDPDIQVIIVSGHATAETTARAMERGASECLRKPCHLAELEAVVAGAVQRRRLRLESAHLRKPLPRAE